MAGQPTRFYGLALGKEKNFSVATDGLLAEAATGTSVATKSLFYTNNTTSTILSNLYDGVEGQIVTLVMLDSNTTIVPTSTYLVSDSGSAIDTGQTYTLLQHNDKWYEVSRGNIPVGIGLGGYETQSIVATSSITVTNASRVVNIVNTALGGSNQTITAISGGYIGQQILLENGSVGRVLLVTSGRNIMFTGTNGLSVASGSAGLLLIKGGTYWTAGI
jgi:hypothetical protein